MGVRALEDIPAGEELFVMYFPSVDYVYRCVKLERLMGIPCSCDHCKDEQKDGLEAYEKREKLRKELMKRVDKQDYPQPWVPLSQHKIYFKQRQERTMGEIAELMTTYGEHRDDYRPDMSVFWADLTAMSKLMSVRSQDPAEAKFYVESVFNMLRCEGVELTDDPKPKGRQRSVSQLKGLPIRTLPYGPSKSCIRALVDLSVHYSVTERDEKTSAVWWKVAETVALLTKTPSREVFERLYKPVSQVLILWREETLSRMAELRDFLPPTLTVPYAHEDDALIRAGSILPDVLSRQQLSSDPERLDTYTYTRSFMLLPPPFSHIEVAKLTQPPCTSRSIQLESASPYVSMIIAPDYVRCLNIICLIPRSVS
jgi:hypothetical protein